MHALLCCSFFFAVGYVLWNGFHTTCLWHILRYKGQCFTAGKHSHTQTYVQVQWLLQTSLTSLLPYYHERHPKTIQYSV